MTDITYLHVAGLLHENMVYTPLPGKESSRRGRPIEGDPAFQLALLSRAGEVVLSTFPEVKPSGCRAVNDPLEFDVRGLLPLNPLATAYELRKGEILLHRADIPADPPEPPDVKFYCTDTTFSVSVAAGCTPTQGDASDTVYSIAAVMPSGRRFTLANGLFSVDHTIDLAEMPEAGKSVIRIGVHDGVRSTEIEVGEIDVPYRKPAVHILKPEPYTRIPFGQPVSMFGCCLSMDGRPCSPDGVSWMIDGELFETGRNVIALEGLQPGEHCITLCHEGDGPAHHAETSVIVEIEEPDADYGLWMTLASSLDHPEPV